MGSPSSFNLSLSASRASISQGGSTFTVASVSFGSSPTQLTEFSTSALPSGISTELTTQKTSAGYSTLIVFNASAAAAPGVYNISISASTQGAVRSFPFILEVTTPVPITYALTIADPLSGEGTTDPSPGTYAMTSSSLVTIDASPDAGWHLGYWVVNGASAGNGTQLELVLTKNYTVFPVFAPSPPSPETASISFPNEKGMNSSLTVDGHLYELPVTFSWLVGSSHSVSAPKIIMNNAGSRNVFTGWDGFATTNAPDLTLIVSGDTAISPVYETQYLTSFNFVDCSGQSAAPQLVALQASTGGTVSVRNGASLWLEAKRMYQVTSAYWDGVDVVSNSSILAFTASSPRTLTLGLPVCLAEVKVSDIFGMPVSSATVVLSFPNGTQLSSSTNSQGVAAFPQSPEIPHSATIEYLGMSYEVSGTTSPTNVTIALSYPLLYAVLAFLILLSGVAVAGRYRAKIKLRYHHA
jgi:hypothetical protein